MVGVAGGHRRRGVLAGAAAHCRCAREVVILRLLTVTLSAVRVIVRCARVVATAVLAAAATVRRSFTGA